MRETISSTQNPKIKNLKKLDKFSERKAQNLILIEGLRETVLAYNAGYEIHQLFICQEILKPEERDKIVELSIELPEKNVFLITRRVYEEIAYRETTEGVIATVRPKALSLNNLQLKEDALVLVIESVEKPGNLGAMLRTADASAVDAVIITDAKTDIYNPNVVRSSIGTVFTNQLAVCESREAISFLKEKNITIYAAELGAEKFHYEQDFTKGTCIAVGTEATGLSDDWIFNADKKIKIPMLGKIDSLNVSVSAGILLFEALRQRQVMKNKNNG
ncbi:MAG: RNA methyltransferase [Chitinophagales bacterium]